MASAVNLVLANQLFASDLQSFVIIFRPPELFKESFSDVKIKYLEDCLASYRRDLPRNITIVQVDNYRDLEGICRSHKISELVAFDVNDHDIERNMI